MFLKKIKQPTHASHVIACHCSTYHYMVIYTCFVVLTYQLASQPHFQKLYVVDLYITCSDSQPYMDRYTIRGILITNKQI